ncbi:hypothetical protein BGW36DRAFT_434013 [Talaromyces proteolyticus]|uniref:Uncharacterized protein n=1 Tax=Talaromyces proteolyticus TaxID=1131652 RepID=A0AAD4KD71_9EURO|nr:uncharacterized protein BGW36DRAFT_434013 [Talaromyces proteolyticus]KAH8688715.1 hypothetical protein BGW36DRAFT_434013 [Talaromyces proteolyticus]
MSRFFPHPPYAEDQPLSHTILTTHVLSRSITTGTIIGITITGIRQSIPSLRQPGHLPKKLLISSAHNILATMAIASVGLTVRMWGRDAIEWEDRSWRLLENRGQLETDDWTYGGIGVAAAVVALRGRTGPAKFGWKGVTGAMGIGSVGGLVGYLAWRYGINRGRFVSKDEEKRKGL